MCVFIRTFLVAFVFVLFVYGKNFVYMSVCKYVFKCMQVWREREREVLGERVKCLEEYSQVSCSEEFLHCLHGPIILCLTKKILTFSVVKFMFLFFLPLEGKMWQPETEIIWVFSACFSENRIRYTPLATILKTSNNIIRKKLKFILLSFYCLKNNVAIIDENFFCFSEHVLLKADFSRPIQTF